MSGERVDVAILGGGMAGLCLARHLLLTTDRSVVVLEGRDETPPRRQKVGESTVQVAGYYLAKVLRLEEHLFFQHLMKYNLRFYWPTPGRANDRFEDLGQLFIRPFSNVPAFQLDRNVLEGWLRLRLEESSRCDVRTGVRELDVQIRPDSEHRLRYRRGGKGQTLEAGWVVDATGRGRYLARRLDLERRSPIRHGASFWWVDGRVDVERMTDVSADEIRRRPGRRELGHLPIWLATNHFMTRGGWFWVIPLRGKTSLGLVYDHDRVGPDRVNTPERALEWIGREFPLLVPHLSCREILGQGGFRDFALDCSQTLSSERWAITGEAGRFSDPLYSPGSDLIAIHNTLIVDAIRHSDDGLETRCKLYEPLMRTAYSAYVPSFARGYDALGDLETFTLKYAWELAIYFAFYVFPFINDLFTDPKFVSGYLRRFARLGPLNAVVQEFLGDYYRWRAARPRSSSRPELVDLRRVGHLRAAQRTFYEVGLDVKEASRVLDERLADFEEMARFIVAHVTGSVLGDPELGGDRGFVESIDLEEIRFDPGRMRTEAADRRDGKPYRWRHEVELPDAWAPAATGEPV